MPVVRVTRGVVDIPNVDPVTLAEQWRINPFGARSFAHVRRALVGETITLPESEAKRLAAAGIVKLVSP